MSAFVIFFTIVPDDELNIDALDGFVKGTHRLHLKPEGEDRSAFVVTYVRWRCRATTRLDGNNSGCVRRLQDFRQHRGTV
jgi:hypothetical protein